MPKKKELKDVDAIAEKYGIESEAFGDYIHEQKRYGRKGSKNSKGDFTIKQLEYLAKEYLGEITGKESDDEVVE